MPGLRRGTNAFALLASGLYDGAEGSTFGDMVLLKDIDYLPARCPGWRSDREDKPEPSYLMNHCLRCGAKLTDWLDYDHAQPWGALPAAE